VLAIRAGAVSAASVGGQAADTASGRAFA
jgi:hypothetical protein